MNRRWPQVRLAQFDIADLDARYIVRGAFAAGDRLGLAGTVVEAVNQAHALRRDVPLVQDHDPGRVVVDPEARVALAEVPHQHVHTQCHAAVGAEIRRDVRARRRTSVFIIVTLGGT